MLSLNHKKEFSGMKHIVKKSFSNLKIITVSIYIKDNTRPEFIYLKIKC